MATAAAVPHGDAADEQQQPTSTTRCWSSAATPAARPASPACSCSTRRRSAWSTHDGAAGRARGAHGDEAGERQRADHGRQERHGRTAGDDAGVHDPGDGYAASWASGGNMTAGAHGPHARRCCRRACVANGQVLVVGGSTDGTSPLSERRAVERHDDLDGDDAALPAAVQGHTATLLGERRGADRGRQQRRRTRSTPRGSTTLVRARLHGRTASARPGSA